MLLLLGLKHISFFLLLVLGLQHHLLELVLLDPGSLPRFLDLNLLLLLPLSCSDGVVLHLLFDGLSLLT